MACRKSKYVSNLLGSTTAVAAALESDLLVFVVFVFDGLLSADLGGISLDVI